MPKVSGDYDFVIVLGLDGVSSAGLIAADTPHLDSLRANGASTLSARAVMPTSSLPNWGAFLYGADPERTGITSNSWRSGVSELDPAIRNRQNFFPSILSLIKTQRPDLKTGFYTDWAANQHLIEPGTVDLLFIPETPADSTENRFLRAEETLDRALASLRSKDINFLFIHLDLPDHYGHKYGWQSQEYLPSIELMDGLIGRLLFELAASDLTERTLLIVVSDHGGQGTRHGGSTNEEVLVPWIIHGPGIHPGKDLGPLLNVHDTAATVAHALNLRRPAAWTGRPVLSAFTSSPEPVLFVAPSSPETLPVLASHTFGFAAVDPGELDVEIEIDWGDGPTEWLPPETSGTIVSVEKVFSAPGLYSARARAMNSIGVVSHWVDIGTIRVEGTAGMPAGITGLWEFRHASNPGHATIGADLLIIGESPQHLPHQTAGQSQSITLNGVLQTVGGVGNHLRVPHNIGPNGGGAQTNLYSIVYDVLLPSPLEWHAFIQTDLSNSADADFFSRPNALGASPPGSLGRGGIGYSGQPLPRDQWLRIVLTFDLRPGGSIRSYLNGDLFHVYDSATVDSRWALDPNNVLVFADNNGENQPLFVATLATFNRTLTPEEVASLGGPGMPLSTGELAFNRDYREWMDNFPELNDIHPLADPDNDGIANLLEYVLLGHPLTPRSIQFPDISVDSNGLQRFTFIRRVASKFTTQQFVEVSENLIFWDRLPVPHSTTGPFEIIALGGTPERESVTLTLTEGSVARLFFRLGVAEVTFI